MTRRAWWSTIVFGWIAIALAAFVLGAVGTHMAGPLGPALAGVVVLPVAVVITRWCRRQKPHATGI